METIKLSIYSNLYATDEQVLCYLYVVALNIGFLFASVIFSATVATEDKGGVPRSVAMTTKYKVVWFGS